MSFAKYPTTLLLAGLAVLATSAGAKNGMNELVFKSLADLNICAEHNGYDTGACLPPLQAYAKKNPKELFAIAKNARLQFTHWTALQFFEPALGKSPTPAQCADEDLALSVLSGLALPPDYPAHAIAVRVFNGSCFAAVRPLVEIEVTTSKGAGYLPQNACPLFAAKGVNLAACTANKEVAVRAAPVVPEKLPTVDLSTAKFGLIQVFAGPNGERVTLADIPAVPGTFALRVDGVRGATNGKTQVHQQSPAGSGFDYWTQHNGQRWNTLIERGGSYKNYELYVPDLKDAVPVAYREAESRAATEAGLRK